MEENFLDLVHGDHWWNSNENDNSTSTNNNNDNQECGVSPLRCENNGVCKIGSADFGAVGDSKYVPASFNQSKVHINNMYCLCPENFTGVLCEHPVNVCGENEHFCFHGGKCVSFNLTAEDRVHFCDCIHDENGKTISIGRSCEHVATMYCRSSGNVSSSKSTYCTNGGSCKGLVGESDDHPGCACLLGFSGVHCEKVIDIIEETPIIVDPTGEEAGLFLGDHTNLVTFSVLLSLIVICAVIVASIFIASSSRSEIEAITEGGEDEEEYIQNESDGASPTIPPMEAFKTTEQSITSDKDRSQNSISDTESSEQKEGTYC